jgi:hypothetical protein
MSSVPKQGNENRKSILPSSSPSTIGYLGSSYEVADSLPTPAQIGVKAGDSMDSVIGAVKGVAFYTDMIGFGESSNPLTRGMPLKPLGINYFINTAQKCSNGADMYQYFEGIPKGDALGKRVQKAMAEMGLPGLKGLAPGLLEDTKSALNPMPMINALFGSGYPQCVEKEMQVGDLYGKIADPDTGAPWIDTPETAYRGSDGLFYQKRWVLDKNLTRDQWEKAPKTHNPNGTPKSRSGFEDLGSTGKGMAVIGILCLLAFGMMKMK